MEVISLKMEKSLLKEIDNTLSRHLYSTRTEFIRDAIRCKIQQLEKDDAIRKTAKDTAKAHNEEAFKELERQLNTRAE